MKTILLLALVALACASFHSDAQWHSYKSQFGKKYANEKEEAIRYAHFVANQDRAKLYQRINPEAVMGHTRFSDLSPEEFKHMYLNFAPSQLIKATESYEAKGLEIPDSFDWKDNGGVIEVKDQSQCGSCYIFATVANIEGVWHAAGHDLISLSEQQVLDCDKVDDGCGGGWMANVYDYVKENGLEKESDYRYTAYVSKCKYDKTKVVARISGYVNVTDSRDETAMAEYLYGHNVLSVAVDATPFQYYSSGIITSGCSNKFDDLDHAVTLTGYGKSGNTLFWDIKNSWGRSWGEKGYVRVKRGSNTCGVAWVPQSALP